MLEPIEPFEPLSSQDLPEGENWIYQVKWDGVRMLVYLFDKTIKLINRNLNDKTCQYPELLNRQLYCTAESFILDGEIIALKKGKPSFHEIMKRDRLTHDLSIASAVTEIPVYYMVFDCLYLNGKWLTEESLDVRQQILRSVIKQSEMIQIVENFHDGDSLYTAIKSEGLEGVVAKDVTKPYAIGGKDGRWLKIKNYQDLIAVVGGVIFKGQQLSSLALGLYDQEGNLHYIGRVGRGNYKAAEWKAIQNFISDYIQEYSPFANKTEHQKKMKWITPLFTVKVRYLEWTTSFTLRQPVLESFVKANPADCRFDH